MRGFAETNGLFPDPHSVLYKLSLTKHWAHSLSRTGVFLPTWGRVSLSDIWSLFRNELTLLTGPCYGCPLPDEHLCEYLLNDTDDHSDLGPIWHLDGDWWVVFWVTEAPWVTEPNILPTTSLLNCVTMIEALLGICKWGEHLLSLLIVSFPS